MITYRSMSMEDIPAALSLCRSAGWNQVARDWELFLQLNPDGCKVAIDETNKVVGTVTTVKYQEHFSWIGMVLVNPEVRRQGIGTELLQEALHLLRTEETVKLDATLVGREVYLQLDFVDEYPLSRMQISSVKLEGLPHSNVFPVQPNDLFELKAFDQNVFGADRSTLLAWLLKGAPHLAFITKINDQVSGFCFGRRGHNFTHIGPVVASQIGDAINLVSAAIRNCEGNPIILDVSHHTHEWSKWLSSIGFKEQRHFIRMHKGPNYSRAILEKQFAILGPEFG